MLDPQIIVNLLPELCVSADLVRHVTHLLRTGQGEVPKKEVRSQLGVWGPSPETHKIDNGASIINVAARPHSTPERSNQSLTQDIIDKSRDNS
jgi:hypothetical protein